jgi:hypothetical protein
MRTEPAKWKVIAWLAAATLVIFLLAIGLTGLKMSPGTVLANLTRPTTTNTTGSLPAGAWLVDTFRIILAVALVLFPIYLVYMLINPQRRKRLLRDVIFFAVILIAFDQLRRAADRMRPDNPVVNPQQGAQVLGGTPNVVPLEAFIANPPTWLVTLVTVVVVVGIAAMIFGAIWLLTRKRLRDADAIVMVNREAQEALIAIQSGNNLREIIIQCYRRMVEAVRIDRGINRDSALTSREFLNTLTAKGLPADPLRDLTRLFEDARYGNIEGGMRQQLEAVACLEEIIEACRKQKEAA